MARKKLIGRTGSVLLFFCLLMGAGVSGVWARGSPGAQLVLVLDFSNSAGDNQMHSLLPQAAGILVHLLGDHVYLGLVGSGEPDGVIFPTAKLTPEHRNQVLNKLAHVTSAPDQKPLSEVMKQALGAFQPEGPKHRVLFWLAGGAGDLEIEKFAAQARGAGVTVFAAMMAPTSQAAAWQTLTSNTGGSFWEVKNAADLHVPCLKLYQYLMQPQEVPINGSQVLLDKWVKEAVLVMARSTPGKEVVLTSPKKGRITRRKREKTIRWLTGSTCDLITLTHPRPGVWSFTGARPDACKVFLTTDLILTDDGTPTEIGEDEALLVTAALQNAKGTPADPDLLARTQFRAELQLKDTQLIATLTPPNLGDSPELTPGTRVGRFPPLHQEGVGTLRLIALGETIQRLRSLPITITHPWYRITPQPTGAQVLLPLSFKPDPGRRPEQVGGTVTLKSAPGGLGGVFINPAPGAEIILGRPPGCQDLCLADFQLTGTAPGGRPLDIDSGSIHLETPKKAIDTPDKLSARTSSEEKVQRTHPSLLTKKVKRRWVWLALSAVGGVIFLVSAILMLRLRHEADGSESEDSGGFFRKNILRLKAQVENLAKEKAELEAALKDKNKQFNQLQAEKAELEEALERSQKKSQANLKTLEDLEKKLEETEREAQGVKQEYMALYARSQQEKESFKKG